ncbi:hypothetical protein DPMN_134720 [Dreissena polymorpha]|uniref:Uncharacterized protein n=1 Tax=Dreissena polymorpha TaxID=45954 RepID=A0A9D4FZH9_DREPO|nr:hypothetical protein DPMN_134720 [Dreissena polymorpha]
MRQSALLLKFIGSGHLSLMAQPVSLAQPASSGGHIWAAESALLGGHMEISAGWTLFIWHSFWEKYNFVGSADGRHPDSALIYN